MIRVFEAFAGIGTQRMALKKIGIEHEVVCISEINKHSIKSYKAIHGDVLNLGDIRKISPNDIPNHDLFTYSFPCQDISVAGIQRGLEKESGTKSSLLWECEKIIKYKRPKFLLMENVKNLVGKKHRENFDKWLERLEIYGYTNYWQVLNARDYCVPQNRERLFCISILNNLKKFEMPKKVNLNKYISDILEQSTNEKTTVPRNILNSYYLKKGDFGNRFSILNYNDIAFTLTAKSGRSVITNNYILKNKEDYKKLTFKKGKDVLREIIEKDIEVRNLSSLEYWRLMGISDDDYFKAKKVTSENQLYIQAGNAIVVNVLEEIFKNLFFNN